MDTGRSLGTGLSTGSGPGLAPAQIIRRNSTNMEASMYCFWVASLPAFTAVEMLAGTLLGREELLNTPAKSKTEGSTQPPVAVAHTLLVFILVLSFTCALQAYLNHV